MSSVNELESRASVHRDSYGRFAADGAGGRGLHSLTLSSTGALLMGQGVRIGGVQPVPRGW